MGIDLSIIIVSYNSREQIADCLGALSVGCDGLAFEVIVVDNASSDGSAELVAERFPEVRLIARKDNPGFSTACNQALRLARGRYELLLNPDTIVPPGALTGLVEVGDRNPEAGLIGPAIYRLGKGKLQSSFRPLPSWEAAFRHYTIAKPLLKALWLSRRRWRPVIDTPTTAGGLTGACLLIRREVFEKIGGLDERYFLFYEDLDYCRRAIRAGWGILYTHKVSVFHHSGKSTSKERPSRMGFVGVKSLLHYLDGESEKPSPALRALFKLGYLLRLLCRIAASGAKALVYALTGRAEKAARHAGRFRRDADFLRRFTGPFLRL